jgi:hypothetical protein
MPIYLIAICYVLVPSPSAYYGSLTTGLGNLSLRGYIEELLLFRLIFSKGTQSNNVEIVCLSIALSRICINYMLIDQLANLYCCNARHNRYKYLLNKEFVDSEESVLILDSKGFLLVMQRLQIEP